jgi:hypothetical protein
VRLSAGGGRTSARCKRGEVVIKDRQRPLARGVPGSDKELESLRGTLSRVAQRGHDRRLRLEGQAGETAPPAGTTAVRPGTPALACTRD